MERGLFFKENNYFEPAIRAPTFASLSIPETVGKPAMHLLFSPKQDSDSNLSNDEDEADRNFDFHLKHRHSPEQNTNFI